MVAHQIDASEVDLSIDFEICDKDRTPIDDFQMIKQWRFDNNFKVIIDGRFSRKKVREISEVS